MRQIRQYSAEFKEKLLAKVFSPNAPSRLELARRANIPYPTLVTWITMSKKKQKVKFKNHSIRPKDKTAEAKFQAVSDTLQMTEEERGAYCRKHGFYTHHLEEWKKQIFTGLETTCSKEQKKENNKVVDEIKKLNRDLHRKDKALAEVSALLILKKKADLLWGVHEDD